MLTVGVIGHSYVNDLEILREYWSYSPHKVAFEWRYFGIPGSTFSSWLELPKEFYFLKYSRPHAIVVLLGSTSITNRVSDTEWKQDCKQFYRLLNQEFPYSLIVGMQVEMRFMPYPNQHYIPPPAIYERRRRILNTYLKKVFKALGSRFYIAMIAGPGRLDNKDLYETDYCSLNIFGLRKLFDILSCTLSFAHTDLQKRILTSYYDHHKKK